MVTERQRRHLRLVTNGGDPSAPTTVPDTESTGHSGGMPDEAVRLEVRRRSDGVPVNVRDAIRAVYEGRDEPEQFVVSLAEGPAAPRPE